MIGGGRGRGAVGSGGVMIGGGADATLFCGQVINILLGMPRLHWPTAVAPWPDYRHALLEKKVPDWLEGRGRGRGGGDLHD
jgi:hypothetical protein